jgi:hypothetical protein
VRKKPTKDKSSRKSSGGSSRSVGKKPSSKRNATKKRSPSHIPKPSKKPAKRPATSRKAKAPKAGFVYADPKDSDAALENVDRALSDVSESFSGLFPELSFDVRSYPPYKDGSVSGQVVISGNFEGYKEEDWRKLLMSISGEGLWPVAHKQTSDTDKRTNGGFWFSAEFRFDVPDGRAWRALESRYDRYAGGWKTSTNWRHSRQSNLALFDSAFWGTQKGAMSIPGLLQQEKFDYKVQQVALKLVWTPDGRQPEWK